MDTRDTDVIQPLDMASHHFRGHTGFFRHGHVRSSRGDYEYMSVLFLPGWTNRHNTRIGIVLCPPIQTANRTRDRQVEGEPLAALLTADIEAPTERILLSRDPAMLRAQVLVVPHHGSKTSSTEPFLDSIDPLVALFQVGYRNRFHHPSAGVLARYSARHIELGRSDADGAVRVLVEPHFAARGDRNAGSQAGPQAGLTGGPTAGPTTGPTAGPDADPQTRGAELTVERYRETQRRYWMDR